MTVLPPGEWDPSIRIEPPDAVPSQDNRLASAKSGGNGNEGNPEHDPAGDREEQLKKTGRLEAFFLHFIFRKKVNQLNSLPDVVELLKGDL